MNLPPLVERELRAAARRPGFFWLRSLLALAAGFKGYELLDRFVTSSPPRVGNAAFTIVGAVPAPVPVITGADLLHELAWLVFLATLFMGLFSADSINRERRGGTLGLLLLTDLTPVQIVYSKLLATGLTSLLSLLGFLPAIMMTVLAGGVSGTQATLTGLGLVNTLFVVLAAGLWASATFRERRWAMLATLGLVGALAFGPELILGTYFGPSGVPGLRLLGLAGWMTAAQMSILASGFLAKFGVLVFVGWFGVTHALGWLLLRQAACALSRTWRDEAHKLFREPEPADPWSSAAPYSATPDTTASGTEAGIAPARASWLTDPRPWDADPIRWLMERMGSPEPRIWLAVWFNFFAQFGLLGTVFDARTSSAGSWGVQSFVGLIAMAAASAVLAAVGARFFQHSRQQQDLELLLTTPVGAANILKGQWRVLGRALVRPVGLLLALAFPAGIAAAYDWANSHFDELWLLLPPFLIALNLAVETLALCFVGMQFGLRSRNRIIAVARTVGWVQLAPLALALAILWLWGWLTAHSPSLSTWFENMPAVIPALLFFLAKNVALIVWARFRMRRDLRLGGRWNQMDAPARRLVLQPA